jgi:hypothetical protein
MATERGGATAGPLVHDLGPAGTVVISTESDDVRVRAVDGTEARVVAPADGAGIETVAEPGRFTVRPEGATRGVIVGFRFGSRGFGFHAAGTIEVEVPRDARVEVRTAAGDVALRDVRGGVAVRTASGDISIKRAGGQVVVGAASGDVLVEALDAIALEARSVSGEIRARAPLLERVAVETVSGDVDLAGALGPTAEHVISTVSGDVDLAVAGGLTVALRTVSGAVDCSHPDRREGDGRRRPLVVGDGAARLAVRTMSGDLEIRALRPAGSDVRSPLPPAPPARPAPPAAPAPPAPPAPVAPPSPPAPIAPLPGAPDSTPDATLATLEALARGEIDVAEAERRLAAAAPASAPADGTAGGPADA